MSCFFLFLGYLCLVFSFFLLYSFAAFHASHLRREMLCLLHLYAVTIFARVRASLYHIDTCTDSRMCINYLLVRIVLKLQIYCGRR